MYLLCLKMVGDTIRFYFYDLECEVPCMDKHAGWCHLSRAFLKWLHWLCCKWYPVPYILHNLAPEPYGPWLKVVHCIGNRVPIGTYTLILTWIDLQYKRPSAVWRRRKRYVVGKRQGSPTRGPWAESGLRVVFICSPQVFWATTTKYNIFFHFRCWSYDCKNTRKSSPSDF